MPRDGGHVTNRKHLRSDQGNSAVDTRTSVVESEQETAPASAANTSEGLTEPIGGSAMQQDTNVTRLRRQVVAVDYLEMCARKLNEAKQARLVAVRAARDHGLSYQTIGDALGLTEAGVRQIVYRAGGDA